MVLWCKKCNALIGVRDPVTNWATDRTTICAVCLQKTNVTPLDPEKIADEGTSVQSQDFLSKPDDFV